MRACYDRDSDYIAIYFVDEADINSRRDTLNRWSAFDKFVTKELKYLSSKGYSFVSAYSEPWLYISRTTGKLHQQWSSEPMTFNDLGRLDLLVTTLLSRSYEKW
jgi:hypothetical protein